jgi:hypothetical protein
MKKNQWLCSCGTINKKNTEICPGCETTKEQAKEFMKHCIDCKRFLLCIESPGTKACQTKRYFKEAKLIV